MHNLSKSSHIFSHNKQSMMNCCSIILYSRFPKNHIKHSSRIAQLRNFRMQNNMKILMEKSSFFCKRHVTCALIPSFSFNYALHLTNSHPYLSYVAFMLGRSCLDYYKQSKVPSNIFKKLHKKITKSTERPCNILNPKHSQRC